MHMVTTSIFRKHVNRRWLAVAGGLIAAALPLTIAVASVQIQDFGPSRFTTLGNCDVPISGMSCAAVQAISKSPDDPGLFASGPSGLALAADGRDIGISAFSATGRALDARSNTNTAIRAQAPVGIEATGTGAIGMGIVAKAPVVAVQASSPNTAVAGNGEKIGVYGHSLNGVAVQAESGLTAVKAQGGAFGVIANGASTGVSAGSDGLGGRAVFAVATGSRGVALEGGASAADGLGARFSGGRAQIELFPASTVGAPTSGNHDRGELFLDNNGDLFLCKQSGTPGKWVKIG